MSRMTPEQAEMLIREAMVRVLIPVARKAAGEGKELKILVSRGVRELPQSGVYVQTDSVVEFTVCVSSGREQDSDGGDGGDSDF